MNERSTDSSSTALRIGGWSLIAAAAGFIAVFSYLAARFDYPAVLNGNAAQVLPRLMALGSAGRAVWVAYAVLPLLLIPAAVGIGAMLRAAMPHAIRTAMACATVAAICMTLGLARWPTLYWSLAQSWQHASPDARVAIDAVFLASNHYLGQFIGEFLGELGLSVFFAGVGAALVRGGRARTGYGGLAVAAVGTIASLRNVTDVVRPIATLNNIVLPVWLVILGVVLLRSRPYPTTS